MLLSGILTNTTSFFRYACHMLRHSFDYRSDKLWAEQIMKRLILTYEPFAASVLQWTSVAFSHVNNKWISDVSVTQGD
jgi:hypothetical protein